MMADLDRVKRNVSRMISMNAPETDIDEYIASEGATVDQIRAHKTATAQPSASVDPAKEKARSEVAEWRKANPVKAAISGAAGDLVRGTPVGSYLDEFAAGVDTLRNGRTYEENVALRRAQNEASDENSPVVGSLPLVGDVAVSGLTKLAGGIASAPLAPVARIFQGGAMLPRIGNALASGVGYGAVYGAGEGEGEERVGNALTGAALGGTLGAAAPVVATGVGNAVRGVRDAVRPLPRGVNAFSRPAVERLRQVADMDNLTPQDIASQAARLGPDGMLADMSENMRTVTEGLNQQPGPARTEISTDLRRRQAGAPGRIEADMNVALGQPANLPATITATQQHYRQAAAPLYNQFHQTPIPQTPQITQIVEQVRQAEPGVFNRALRLALADGVNPRYLVRLRNNPMTPMTGQQSQQAQRVWQGVELDYLKRAVDDLARDAGPGTNEQRIFGNLARTLRTSVDEVLSPGQPDQSIWARARGIAEEGFDIDEAIEQGRTAFNKNLSADQLEANIQGSSQLEQEGLRVGAREALRSQMANASTNFRANGDAAARRTLNAPEARRKLAMVAETPAGAQQLNRRISAENSMAETFDQTMGNSATARRQATRNIVPRQYDAASMRELRGTSLTGAVAEGVGRLFNFLTAGALNERNGRIAADMAQMLVAQGVQRDVIARGLMDYAQTARVSAAQRNNINRFAEQLIRGSTAPAISNATSP